MKLIAYMIDPHRWWTLGAPEWTPKPIPIFDQDNLDTQWPVSHSRHAGGFSTACFPGPVFRLQTTSLALSKKPRSTSWSIKGPDMVLGFSVFVFYVVVLWYTFCGNSSMISCPRNFGCPLLRTPCRDYLTSLLRVFFLRREYSCSFLRKWWWVLLWRPATWPWLFPSATRSSTCSSSRPAPSAAASSGRSWKKKIVCRPCRDLKPITN